MPNKKLENAVEKTLQQRLAEIQLTLNAPKNKMNTFGGYRYRSCEDILQAVKPILNGLTLTLNDDVLMLGEDGAARFYIKATATITDGVASISTSALARESLAKKGMDDAQVTGSASSYARKYALNGLLAIDDSDDADHVDNSKSGTQCLSDKQAADLEAMATEVGAKINDFLAFAGAKSFAEIKEDQYNNLVAALEAKRKKANK